MTLFIVEYYFHDSVCKKAYIIDVQFDVYSIYLVRPSRV